MVGRNWILGVVLGWGLGASGIALAQEPVTPSRQEPSTNEGRQQTDRRRGDGEGKWPDAWGKSDRSPDKDKDTDKDKRSGSGSKDESKNAVPDKFRDRFEKLPPESKRRFMENWQRWKGMDEREREQVMARAFAERDRAEKLIDETLKEMGLDLTKDEREVFELRYRQERRKVEEALQKEVSKLREERVKRMVQELKVEFSGRAPSPE